MCSIYVLTFSNLFWLSFIVAAGQMYNQINHVAHLNDQIAIKDHEIARLQTSDRRNLIRINNLETEIVGLRDNNRELLLQLETLERNNKQIKGRLKKLKPTAHYKSYTQLASKSGKHHRRREYKKIFDNVLEPMSDISRANINVRMGPENINFLWKRQDPTQNEETDDEDGNLVEMFDVEQSNIFDPDGNYVKPFIRSIIYVMDKHKISQEAYHETRMVTKGFMPPIHLIRQERSKMSDEIEYIKHPTVCVISYVIINYALLINV